MTINSITIKTNIASEVALDEARSAFKADKRIWSLTLEADVDGYILQVQSELEPDEVLAKLTSIGLKAELVENR